MWKLGKRAEVVAALRPLGGGGPMGEAVSLILKQLFR